MLGMRALAVCLLVATCSVENQLAIDMCQIRRDYGYTVYLGGLLYKNSLAIVSVRRPSASQCRPNHLRYSRKPSDSMHFKSITCCKWSLSSISWGPAPRLGLLLGGEAVPNVLNVFYLHKPAWISVKSGNPQMIQEPFFRSIHSGQIVVMYLVTGLTAKLISIAPYSIKFSCWLVK